MLPSTMGSGVLPRIELVDADTLTGVNGVYAQANDTIYLSRSFVETASDDALRHVVTEELGHGIDARINSQR